MIDVRTGHDVVAIAYYSTNAVGRPMDRGEFAERLIVTYHNFSSAFALVLRIAAYAGRWANYISSANFQLFPGHKCSSMRCYQTDVDIRCLCSSRCPAVSMRLLFCTFNYKSNAYQGPTFAYLSHVSRGKNATLMP